MKYAIVMDEMHHLNRELDPPVWETRYFWNCPHCKELLVHPDWSLSAEEFMRHLTEHHKIVGINITSIEFEKAYA